MNSKTIEQWAVALAAERGHSIVEWEQAMQRATARGTLGCFVESTSPRVPRILESEIRDWLTQRNGESELNAPPLPANRAPQSFRQQANPGTGHHASRLTIGMRL